MDDYISKPVVQNSILTAITKWLPEKLVQSEMGNPIDPPTEIHFDYAELKNRLGGKEEMVTKILAVSKTSLDSCLADLHKHLEAKDIPALKETAHKLKGVALSSCFNLLAKMAQELEQRDEFDHALYSKLVRSISSEVDSIKKLIL
jgi:HPt (histidine-containing phosphotransfer) domain-containing protein